MELVEVEDPPLRIMLQADCPEGEEYGFECAPDARAAEMAVVLHSLLPEVPPPGAHVRLNALLAEGLTASESVISRTTEESNEITVDFGLLGAATSRVEVYDSGVLISSANGHVGVVASSADWPSRVSMESRDSAATVVFAYSTAVSITVPGSGGVSGDRIVVIAEGGDPVGDYFGFEIRLLDLEGARISASASSSVITEWGSTGTDEGQFQGAGDLAVSPLGIVYVPDVYNHRIQVFDEVGNFLTQWGSPGTGAGQFDQPSAVAIDDELSIYVVDKGNDRIQKFDGFGTFITQWGSHGSGEGQFDGASGITIASNGSIYVTDSNNHRVQRFHSGGSFASMWGTPGTGEGQFLVPTGIGTGPDRSVYVSDNHRVQRFDRHGVFISQWGGQGGGVGEFDLPLSIAVDEDGEVWVSDYFNRRVQKFTKSGEYLLEIGSPGFGPGEFEGPGGVAVYPGNLVFVTDLAFDRIQSFGIGPQATSDVPTPILGESGPRLEAYRRSDGVVVFQFDLAAQAQVAMTVHDVTGRVVESLVDGAYPPGSHSITWERAIGSGGVPSGVYFGRLSTEEGVATAKTVVVR